MPSVIAAVLTGDLIGSTGHPAEQIDQAMDVIRQAAHAMVDWHVPSAETRFTRFRGDGWQMFLQDPTFSLRAALVIAARLRASEAGIGTRLSIAIGEAQSLGTRDLSDAAGPVFQLSGKALDKMPRTARISLTGAGITDRDEIIARQMFERTSRWTALQAEAMALYLDPGNPTLTDLARTLDISPQAVNYRLGGGGATELRISLQLWENVLEEDLARR